MWVSSWQAEFFLRLFAFLFTLFLIFPVAGRCAKKNCLEKNEHACKIKFMRKFARKTCEFQKEKLCAEESRRCSIRRYL